MVDERTFVMVKPDGVNRRFVGEIISRFEKKGLKLVAAKFMSISKDLAKRHYQEHVEKDFYRELEDFITSGPVMAMVWEGDDAIDVGRTLMGKTDPKKSAPGTIRGDMGLTIGKNIIHGSDGPESAKREISLFFEESEILNYDLTEENWTD